MKSIISVAIFASFVLVSFVSASAQETAGVLPVKRRSMTSGAAAPERQLTEIYRVGVGDVLDIRLLNAANNKSPCSRLSVEA